MDSVIFLNAVSPIAAHLKEYIKGSYLAPNSSSSYRSLASISAMSQPFVHIITSLSDGGAEAVLFRLVAFHDPQNHVVISLSGKGKYGPLLERCGVKVHYLNMPRGRLTFGGLRKLFSILRRERPHVVQTWMYHANLVGGLVARLTGCRKVFWNIRHADLTPGAYGRGTRLVSRLCARLSRFVPTGIVACAERARTVHIAEGYDARKFTVIPNGYDIARFRPDAATRDALRRGIGVGPDTVLLGLVGRWNKEKDHSNLLAALSRLAADRRDIRLLLVGTGCTADNAELVSTIAHHGLSGRVIVAGRRDDVPAVMNALDLHILSSSSEAFPNVVAEAMACGTPCVVTDVGDAALIVGETGWIVPPRDADALAAATARAVETMADAALWQHRQDNARRRIEDNFSLATMVARYEALWRDAPDDAVRTQ
ncbi:glycosyltransferase [Devosia sp. YIM 151766]|uniref:glycosyltransferase family 4 protein n=1 Tax=Devosia sp. YIM 151766 TaxID=3017325 RepID=UPI00255CA45A|nr:glycosyltransferase [Devosia sp. YIM 151766]WIY52440.1 glycosyltransferase [Devosia sp. YIM 151766]